MVSLSLLRRIYPSKLTSKQILPDVIRSVTFLFTCILDIVKDYTLLHTMVNVMTF